MKADALVVKVASLCNLNCTYCYVYNMGDNSYKLQPKYMSEDTIRYIFVRINEHCAEHNLNSFLLIFHGGEPLLCGIDFFKKFISIGKNIISSNIKIDYSMQTNGVLLTHEIAKELKEIDIQVGISIDGTPNSNNKNRIFHNGKGGYNDIVKGFNIIKEVFGEEYANCLCVIDTNQDPADVYNHFKELGASNVSFLFQDFNHNDSSMNDVPKVGGWLSKMFDLWYNDIEDRKPNIGPLNDLMSLMFGFEKFTEVYGKGHNGVLVIETNGAIEPVDTLKICGDGFTRTKFNVSQNSFNEVFNLNEAANKYYYSHFDLCETCKRCPIEEICGGGFIGHRFSKENEFNNPSIYCKEIIEIVAHLQNTIVDTMPTKIIEERKVVKMDCDQIIASLYEN